MKTLTIQEDCPKRGRLKQLLRASRRAGFEMLRFSDTQIHLKPYSRRTKMNGVKINQSASTEIPAPEVPVLYSIMISNETSCLFAESSRRVEKYPIWKVESAIALSFPKIAEHFESKGYCVSLINTKHASLKMIRS
jgi:hypothetical protein